MTRVLAVSTTVAVLCFLPAVTSARDLPPELIARHNEAVALMGQFKFAEAVPIFEELVKEYPEMLEIKVDLAIATLNRQKVDEQRRPIDEIRALELLREVLAADPDNVRAHYCAGLLLQRTVPPDTEAALQHYRRVEELDPSDAYAVYQVGRCLQTLGRPEEAVKAYLKSVEINPYLRSGYYSAAMLLRRTGDKDEYVRLLEQHKKLDDNPQARPIEAKYTRMGPNSEVRSLRRPNNLPAEMPRGELFLASSDLVTTDPPVTWRLPARSSVTYADVNGDSELDFFIPGALETKQGLRNAVIVRDEKGGFALALDHPLAAPSDVNAALWGDIDNDGKEDVYLCRKGPNQLWMQQEDGGWKDATQEAKVGGGEFDSVDGAVVDADHDGDLDLFVVNADGPNELFNNDRDGGFRPLAQQHGIIGDNKTSHSVLFSDLDGDRDLDFLVINAQPPHEVYLNDRLWNYRPADGFDALKGAEVHAAVAGDVDADGRTEIYTAGGDGVSVWSRDQDDAWSSRAVGVGVPVADGAKLALADVNGNGALELVVSSGGKLKCLSLVDQRPPVPAAPVMRVSVLMLVAAASGVIVLLIGAARGSAGIKVLSLFLLLGLMSVAWLTLSQAPGPATVAPSQAAGGSELYATSLPENADWTLATLHETQGPSLIVAPVDGAPQISEPGPGRFEYVSLTVSGTHDTNSQTRSNASGVGTFVALRVGDLWTAVWFLRHDSGPGQSRGPVSIGLGGKQAADFVSLRWSEGVSQTELNLKPGKHVITETERQTSSCPVLFAWNGTEYVFVTDLLGVGGMGYLLEPGEYAPPDPTENLLLPQGTLAPIDGKLALKLTEPMEEACYLDYAALVAYDLPPGWNMTLDERMATAAPDPAGTPVFFRDAVLPVAATNERGEDVTETVRSAGHQAAPLPALDRRFLGRLESEHVLTLTFEKPINSKSRRPVLVADGWIEYPYSQTMFAAWQAEASYDPPTLEARGSDGVWNVVLDKFGYPAGMPRQMSAPLTELPQDTTMLRLRTNQEIYWDRIQVAFAEPCPEVKKRHLPLSKGTMAATGFAHRTTGPQRLPHYDYNNRAPLWDCEHMDGDYTEFGPVDELVDKADDALAIFGPGEEVHLEFVAAPPPSEGWTRHYVLETVGWCKDRDLMTKDGETIAPIPSRGEPSESAKRLHQRFNTRYRD